MRKALRAIDAKMIMGKNTQLKAAIADITAEPDPRKADYEQRKLTWKPRPHLNIIRDNLNGNTGLIFTNGDLSAISDILDTQVRAAPAKVGSIAPKGVIIPPGPTGMDPKQTQFFQALNIATKIVRAQIEIVNAVTIIVEGDKINPSQAALLDRLKICPFEYKMHIKSFMENGKLYSAKVLKIKPADVLAAFTTSASNLTAISLASGYMVSSAAPHLIINAFKNLAGASIASGYSFPALEAMKSAAKAAPAPAGGAPAASAPAAAPKKEEKPPVEEDVDMGGMFGDDGDY
jgi:large subunit ribosomal protein LP0